MSVCVCVCACVRACVRACVCVGVGVGVWGSGCDLILNSGSDLLCAKVVSSV